MPAFPHLMYFPIPDFCVILSPIVPAKTEIAEKISQAWTMKIIPRNTIYMGTLPAPVFINWGRNARKKRATLGFRTFMKIPRL